jgi:hypothetical protein
MAVEYVGAVGIGAALGVSDHAVHRWRMRYHPGSTHPFPEPDVEVDGTPGWRPTRLPEVKRWRDGLVGAGGDRPTATREEFFAVATRHNFDRDEAERTLTTFHEEFPEMTEPQLCAWLVEKFS